MTYVIKVRAASGAWVPLDGKHVEYKNVFTALDVARNAALYRGIEARVEYFGGAHDGKVVGAVTAGGA